MIVLGSEGSIQRVAILPIAEAFCDRKDKVILDGNSENKNAERSTKARADDGPDRRNRICTRSRTKKSMLRLGRASKSIQKEVHCSAAHIHPIPSGSGRLWNCASMMSAAMALISAAAIMIGTTTATNPNARKSKAQQLPPSLL